MTTTAVRPSPAAAVGWARAYVSALPASFVAAFLAVVVNLADAAKYPSAAADSGGIKIHGLRIADVLALLSLLASAGALISGRLRFPPSLGIPVMLAVWVWAWGLAVGLEKHASHKIVFAECHLLLYVIALPLAYLQVPRRVVRQMELLLVPIAFLGVLVVLPRGGAEKGGDISTIGAGIATVMLIRHRIWVGLPLALVSVTLLATGGQRAALLFAGPPLLVAVVIALRRARLTSSGVVVIGLVVALLGAATGPLAHEVSAKLHTTFNSTQKAQSGSSRIDQLHLAEHDISEAPWFGQGLGHQYQLYNNDGTGQIALTDITHDIYVDVTLRFGFVGLAVIVLILLLGAVKLARSWRRLTTYRTLLVLLLLSLLVHGAVESILDKPRLTVFAGWIMALLLTSPEVGEDSSTLTWTGSGSPLGADRPRRRVRSPDAVRA